MKYYIFVDESGSINNIKDGVFLVSLCIVREVDFKRTRKMTKRKLNDMKSKMGLSRKTELKAHDLNRGKDRNKIEKLVKYWCESCGVEPYGTFLKTGPKLTNTKWINRKNITFNFMVKIGLERAMKNIKLSPEDEIIFIIDERNVGTGSLKSLEDYLYTQLVLERGFISGVSVEYWDSHAHWGVQMADIFAAYYRKQCLTGKAGGRIRELLT